MTNGRKRNFHQQFGNLLDNVSTEINLLSRVFLYVSTNQENLLCSRFGCCPLVWISPDRTLSKCINKLCKLALRLAYNDYKSCFSDVLKQANSATKHAGGSALHHFYEVYFFSIYCIYLFVYLFSLAYQQYLRLVSF